MKNTMQKRQEADIAEDADVQSLISTLLSPSQLLARWYLAIGAFGLSLLPFLPISPPAALGLEDDSPLFLPPVITISNGFGSL